MKILRWLAIACIFSGCANYEIRTAALQPVERSEQPSSLSVTFLGTTSFLIETSTEQFLLDGYLSRSRHLLTLPIQPSAERLDPLLHDLSICKSASARNLSGQNVNCLVPEHQRLSLVLTLHGHYDHVMDAPYIAGWAGAPMLLDQSAVPLWNETRRVTQNRAEEFNWPQAEASRLSLGEYVGSDAAPVPLESMKVRLFKTEHNENLISGLIEDRTPSSFRFPSPIWDMGLGHNLSVWIEHDRRRILFVGSAGKIGTVFSDADIKADVVFLSIGGLSLRPREEWDAYWSDVVRATGAKRVYLTHWDNHQKPLEAPDYRLTPTVFENHDAVYKHFRFLAAEDRVDIVFAPVAERFDPF
ncbi:MBL fold metallo-hydrolase [Sulfitobacter sp. HNIBRBA3233]|uniref:MBL fold metallo-hydrolase n=1 Tax=Sulfitobacter marinivivus TaxID=3158558 RepID=UPI0032DFDC7E